MASNPLIGKRIGLVSKKNIRYEGILYSINEQNATLALQNVVSYGTEGRESTTFVPPELDAVHPFLLFRGQDITDLHVHDEAAASDLVPATPSKQAAPSAPATPAPDKPSAAAPASAKHPAPQKQDARPAMASSYASAASGNKAPSPAATKAPVAAPRAPQLGAAAAMAPVGTGASLLQAPAWGQKSNNRRKKPQEPVGEFDFAANQRHFERTAQEEVLNEDATPAASYLRPDKQENIGADIFDNGFFDTISSDALDKKAGVDNRLYGAQERHLNTETFGAVALKTNQQHRRRYNNNNSDSGRGRGGGGRGRGRGRGDSARGRGEGDRASSTGRGSGGTSNRGQHHSISNKRNNSNNFSNRGGRGRGSQRQQPQ